MRIERRLERALRSADHFHPSGDLFARVERSLEEDRRHRKRVARAVIGAFLVFVLLFALVATNASTTGGGNLVIQRWALELGELMLMTVLTLSLGPAIRRFGKNYATDNFGGNDEAVGEVLRLLDVAYYLVFSGFILTSVDLEDLGALETLGDGLQDSASRLGLLMLLMGALHVGTLASLPVVGLIHSSVIWRARKAELHGANFEKTASTKSAERWVETLVILVWVALLGGAVWLAPILIGLLVGTS